MKMNVIVVRSENILGMKLDPNDELPYPLDPENDSSSTPPLTTNLHNISILGTLVGLAIRAENTLPEPAEIGEPSLPIVLGIKPADMELKEIKLEVDLKHKDNIFIEINNEPKSQVSKFGSSILIIEDSDDRMNEKIDDRHSNSTVIFQNNADYVKNKDVVVLNPLENGSVLVQKLLYSKCSNYNANESLDKWILKLVEHRTIVIGVNDSMINSESRMTTEVYTIKALQGEGEFEFVHDPGGNIGFTENFRGTNRVQKYGLTNRTVWTKRLVLQLNEKNKTVEIMWLIGISRVDVDLNIYFAYSARVPKHILSCMFARSRTISKTQRRPSWSTEFPCSLHSTQAGRSTGSQSPSQSMRIRAFNNATVPPSAQATFPSIFAVGKFLQAGTFDLVGYVVYEMEQYPYQSTFYNGTIEVIEAGCFVSVESVFLFSLGVALLVLLALWVHSQIQRLSKKIKRVPKVEIGTGTTDTSMDECHYSDIHILSISPRSLNVTQVVSIMKKNP
ncbi:hypothetical protein LguiA_027619 [Lonicera macranthoides]